MHAYRAAAPWPHSGTRTIVTLRSCTPLLLTRRWRRATGRHNPSLWPLRSRRAQVPLVTLHCTLRRIQVLDGRVVRCDSTYAVLACVGKKRLLVRAGEQPAAAGCPVKHSEGEQPDVTPTPVDPRTRMPTGLDTAAPSDCAALAKHRQTSSIPLAPSVRMPGHQPAAADAPSDATDPSHWVYPSEQMFYNAMRRKACPRLQRIAAGYVGRVVAYPVRVTKVTCTQGWQPSEADMRSVVDIHNAVNERTWQHILHWERLHARSCAAPTLKRFEGRPKHYSPKAMLLNCLGYKLPFDRHDWYVDRCGVEVRYVIDFYSGAATAGAEGTGMYLDVRPALDSFGAAVDRLRMTVVQALSWV